MSQRLDQLRAAAEAEWAATHGINPQPTEDETPVEPEIPPVEPPTPETPLEDEPPALDEPQTPEEPPEEQKPPVARRVVYKKVVDLGDGNPQVFSASTKDELIEKILAAQLNASKRIKELKAENKALKQAVQPDPARPIKKLEPRSLSQEEELELVNELQTIPSSAVQKAVESLFGASTDEIRKDLNDLRNFKQKAEFNEIGQQFIQAHPEYPITPENEKLMADYIRTNNLGWTLRNLELAFAELQDAGLVSAKAVSVPDSVQEGIVEEEEPEEVVAPVAPAPAERVLPVRPAPTSEAVARRRRAVVGVSSRQSVATDTPAAPHEVSVEELLKMSPEDRRRIVMASSRQA